MRKSTFAQLSAVEEQTEDECESRLSKRITRSTEPDWRKQNILKKFQAPRVDGSKRKEVTLDFGKSKTAMVPLSIQRIITAIEEATRKASIAIRLPHIVNNLDRFAVAMGTEVNQLLKYHTRIVQSYEGIQKRLDELLALRRDFMVKAQRGAGVDELTATNESDIGARLFDDFDVEEDEDEGEKTGAADAKDESGTGGSAAAAAGETQRFSNPIISITVATEEQAEENNNASRKVCENWNQSAKRRNADSDSRSNGSIYTSSLESADKISFDGKDIETTQRKKGPRKRYLTQKSADKISSSTSGRKINSDNINRRASKERTRLIQNGFGVETTRSGCPAKSSLVPVPQAHPSGTIGLPPKRGIGRHLASGANSSSPSRDGGTTDFVTSEGSREGTSHSQFSSECQTSPSPESMERGSHDINKNASVDSKDQKIDSQATLVFVSQRELDDAVLNLCGVTELLAASFRTLLKKFLVNPSAMEMVYKEAKVDSKSSSILELMDELKDLFLYRIMTTPEDLEERAHWVDQMTKQEKINRNTIQKLEEKLALINQTSESSQYNEKYEELKQLQMDLHQIEKFADEAIRRARAEADKLEVASTRDSEDRVEDMEADIEFFTNSLETDLSQHQEIEAELRVERYKLEHELETWIKKYDEEMIDRMETYEYVELLYTDELVILGELEDRFADLEREYNGIMEERHNARLAVTVMQRTFKRTAVAVMMIQSMYRAFKVRRALATDRKRKAKEEKKRLRLERKAAREAKAKAKEQQAKESTRSSKSS